MSRKRIQKSGSFTARDEKGNQHVIDVFQTYIDVSDSDGHAELPGLPSLMTRGGQHVNRDGKGEYSIPALGIKLTSNDPNAL